MANIFDKADIYYSGYVGPYHVRLPNTPEFWLWAAEGGPVIGGFEYSLASLYAVRALWLNVLHAQEFFIQQLEDCLGRPQEGELASWDF